MDVADFWSNMAHAILLFIGAVPEALRLSYDWAKEWQTLLAGVLLVIAARVLAQGHVRAARLRATAMIRAAQLGTEPSAPSGSGPKDFVGELAQGRRRAQLSPEALLRDEVEQLRRLIRSAMSTLTTETSADAVGSNFYCQKILGLRLEHNALPADLTPETRALFDRLVEQLALVRQANVDKLSATEFSNTLVKLNGRAREFAAALAPPAAQNSASPQASAEPASTLGAPVPLHVERKKAASTS